MVAYGELERSFVWDDFSAALQICVRIIGAEGPDRTVDRTERTVLAELTQIAPTNSRAPRDVSLSRSRTCQNTWPNARS